MHRHENHQTVKLSNDFLSLAAGLLVLVLPR
jgi:hypothetical protein